MFWSTLQFVVYDSCNHGLMLEKCWPQHICVKIIIHMTHNGHYASNLWLDRDGWSGLILLKAGDAVFHSLRCAAAARASRRLVVGLWGVGARL